MTGLLVGVYAGLVLLATEVFRLHQLPRAGTVRMRCTPVPHARCENLRPALRLTIEATIQI